VVETDIYTLLSTFMSEFGHQTNSMIQCGSLVTGKTKNITEINQDQLHLCRPPLLIRGFYVSRKHTLLHKATVALNEQDISQFFVDVGILLKQLLQENVINEGELVTTYGIHKILGMYPAVIFDGMQFVGYGVGMTLTAKKEEEKEEKIVFYDVRCFFNGSLWFLYYISKSREKLFVGSSLVEAVENVISNKPKQSFSLYKYQYEII